MSHCGEISVSTRNVEEPEFEPSIFEETRFWVLFIASIGSVSFT